MRDVKLGDHVTPRPGHTWCGRPVPMVPHTVVAVHDYRSDGGEVILVLQDTSVLDHLTSLGHPVNPDYGVYLGGTDVVA